MHRFTGRSRSRSITPVNWRRAANEGRLGTIYQKQISNHIQQNVKDKDEKDTSQKANGEAKDNADNKKTGNSN